jgi:4-aminobutyrate aminotransferase
LGGGILPLAALIAREDLDITPDRALGHYTHEKNPVACAAAIATIEYIEEESLLENAKKMGTYAMDRMRKVMQQHKTIGEVRGLGLMMGMELVKDPKTKEPATQEAEQVMYSALSKGLNFKVTMGSILTLTPPLTITAQQMDKALNILEKCLWNVEG